MDPILELPELYRRILFSLPPEPAGKSVADLADDLLGDLSQAGRQRIEEGLAAIRAVVGIHVAPGPCTLLDGGQEVPLYALPAESMPRVRRVAALVDWWAGPKKPPPDYRVLRMARLRRRQNGPEMSTRRHATRII